MRTVRFLACAAVAATLLATSGTATASSTATYKVWTWNVAGWAMHRGSTTDGLITVLSNSIRNRDADFAALNELCWSQYKAVQSNLRNSGWPQDVENFSRFEPHNDGGCGGEPYGLAIFSRAPLGPADRWALADDGSSERRKLLCAALQNTPTVRFCTTHITPSNDVINGEKINETQLTEVLGHLEAYHDAGQTVLIAGDFNAQPNYGRLDQYYSASLDVPNNDHNTGHYRELDDTDPGCPGYGETTTPPDNTEGLCDQGKKIDLAFVREDRIAAPYTADSLTISTSCTIGACSDHRILTGTVTVTQ